MADGSTAEGNAIQEIMVLPDPTGAHQLRAWYTVGWDSAAIRMGTSDDGGLTWTKGTVDLIGRGAGGVSTSVSHTGLWDEGGGLNLTISYTDPNSGTTTLNKVTSTDGGLTWGSPTAILTASGWETGRWGNSACVKVGSTWHLLYESMDTSSVWQTGYATSTDGVTFTRQNGGQPIRSLQVGAGTYGGCFLIHKPDATWELFYHASVSGVLPTDCYRAVSTDLINWERRPGAPTVSRTLSWEVDQTADSDVHTIGGQRVMFYSGVDNPNKTSKIGRAVYVPAM